ncbi:hypothetical protein [Tateyamaria sp.]|uniref:hypothetical protein n=1 Tax=Tateyamaria sp. TaxID=1929288 RepID=UPI00329F1A68
MILGALLGANTGTAPGARRAPTTYEKRQIPGPPDTVDMCTTFANGFGELAKFFGFTVNRQVNRRDPLRLAMFKPDDDGKLPRNT